MIAPPLLKYGALARPVRMHFLKIVPNPVGSVGTQPIWTWTSLISLWTTWIGLLLTIQRLVYQPRVQQCQHMHQREHQHRSSLRLLELATCELLSRGGTGESPHGLVS